MCFNCFKTLCLKPEKVLKSVNPAFQKLFHKQKAANLSETVLNQPRTQELG